MMKNNNSKEDPPAVNLSNPLYIKKGTRKKLDPRFIKYDCIAENKHTIETSRHIKRNKKKLKRIRNN